MWSQLGKKPKIVVTTIKDHQSRMKMWAYMFRALCSYTKEVVYDMNENKTKGEKNLGKKISHTRTSIFELVNELVKFICHV